MRPSTFEANFEVGVLGHLERVHVGAQQGGGTVPVALDDRNNRAAPLARLGGKVEDVQCFEDQSLGDRKNEASFGLGVDPPAHLDRVVQYGAGLGDDLRCDLGVNGFGDLDPLRRRQGRPASGAILGLGRRMWGLARWARAGGFGSAGTAR